MGMDETTRHRDALALPGAARGLAASPTPSGAGQHALLVVVDFRLTVWLKFIYLGIDSPHSLDLRRANRWYSLLLLLLALPAAAGALAADGQALLAFKAAVLRDPEGALANWNFSTAADPCAWNGNGALENRGPTAFVGNPGLCGPPLKNPCSPDAMPSSNPFMPKDGDSAAPGAGHGKNRGLGKVAIVAIVLSDVVGILFIALVFFYCYWMAVSSKEKRQGGAAGLKGSRCGKDCGCFSRDESATPSEDAEQYDLVALDQQVRFDLDELLKAVSVCAGEERDRNCV
ncbi:hypothetical protein GUJ93_ZPchr0001g30711 [Zizania palustris]|uniref:Leucine-rich repeat-containing N-terminal plant-type domain-containing protein n=1 Tax=Zizania palustris TaxID=103762 RepID=A0A8J5VLC2_ZIZPA|nr:hypothetical protein GUJ93_ZPchr0001g30711 [Zizania palustris]